MANLDKNMNTMDLTLTVTKVAFVTIAAFIHPLLVVPALVIADLVSAKLSQTVHSTEETFEQMNGTQEAYQPMEQDLIIERIEEPKVEEEPAKKVRKKRTPKNPDASQSPKASKPRGGRSKKS